MITIAQAVEEHVLNTPGLDDLLVTDVVNVSALARKIQPEIAAALWKEDISLPAMIMALKRLQKKLQAMPVRNVDLSSLGDITVRSNLTILTYDNSPHLLKAQLKVLEYVEQSKERFLNVSQGLHQTSIIVTTDAIPVIEKHLKDVKPSYRADELASITMGIPHDSTFIPGFIYNVLKPIALAGINLIDIVSVNKEITFILADDEVDKAFSIFKRLKKLSKQKVDLQTKKG